MNLFEKIELHLGNHQNIIRFGSPLDFRSAATLLPFYEQNGELQIIYIQRAKSFLPDGREAAHSGQIAFPGGKIENGETELEAAIREAEEEINLEEKDFTIVGKLGEFSTHVSGFLTHIFLARIDGEPDLKMCEDEVADIVAVPVDALLDLHRPELDAHNWVNVMKLHYHWQVPMTGKEICIWGMTGRATWCLLEMLNEIGF
ncbi:MAG: CoA pyrophosphatase [Calditrichaeota bacterium]|nr:MAG: CoA pyrophosphatase [Calditrichota bacterium]